MPTETIEQTQTETVIENNPSTPEPITPATPKKKLPIKAIVFAAILIVIGGVVGYRTWSFNQTHASTDDAQISTDSVSIIPQVTGTVSQVLVDDNQAVKKGQLIATIDDRQFQAQVSEAQANLDAAIAQAKSAGVGIDLTQATGNAQITQSQGLVGQAQSGVASANANVAKAEAGIENASAGRATARANILYSQSAVSNARSGVGKAEAQLAAARAVVKSAQAAVASANSNVNTAQSSYNLAEVTAQRYQNLFTQGAISRQVADEKTTAAQIAESNLVSARQQAAAAQANLATQEANLDSALQGVKSANDAVSQAQAQVQVAQSQSRAASAGYGEALAERTAAAQAVNDAVQKQKQAEGQLAQAMTSNTQVSVSKAQQLQALAKVEQAKAALAQAVLNLSYTKIYAPEDGLVTAKQVDPGQLVSPNAPILTLVQQTGAYVIANYKETQMDGIVVGDTVDVSVDAFPDKDFTAKVQSIQAGTGSSFTLLPPDNASGNFTKVVQRIPVKIVFTANQSGLDQLRDGMSVTAITKLRGK